MTTPEIGDLAQLGAQGLLVYQLGMKVLGPAGDVIGKQLAKWSGKSLENIERVLKNAAKRIGNTNDSKKSIPMRVAKSLILEAPFCDDPLASEYFGGVLASSRSGTDRDDRGVAFLAQLSQMSSYQLRIHYILYHTAKKLAVNDEAHQFSRFNKGIWVGFQRDSFFKAMEFAGTEISKASVIVDQALAGMERDELIGAAWGLAGSARSTQIALPSNSPPYWVVIPILDCGVDLFMWSYGLGNEPMSSFFSPEVVFDPVPGVILPQDAQIVRSAIAKIL